MDGLTLGAVLRIELGDEVEFFDTKILGATVGRYVVLIDGAKLVTRV